MFSAPVYILSTQQNKYHLFRKYIKLHFNMYIKYIMYIRLLRLQCWWSMGKERNIQKMTWQHVSSLYSILFICLFICIHAVLIPTVTPSNDLLLVFIRCKDFKDFKDLSVNNIFPKEPLTSKEPQKFKIFILQNVWKKKFVKLYIWSFEWMVLWGRKMFLLFCCTFILRLLS